jgi:hypothetical protein
LTASPSGPVKRIAAPAKRRAASPIPSITPGSTPRPSATSYQWRSQDRRPPRSGRGRGARARRARGWPFRSGRFCALSALTSFSPFGRFSSVQRAAR